MLCLSLQLFSAEKKQLLSSIRKFMKLSIQQLTAAAEGHLTKGKWEFQTLVPKLHH
jgi:hypothetical protein